MLLSSEALFPSEDLNFGGTSLYVDLIPSSSWGGNLRALMAPSKWKDLSKQAIERAGGVCEICSFTATAHSKSKTRMECHERWSFEEQFGTQTLKRLLAICSSCHRATHFGFAQSIGRGHAAQAQIRKVNNWTNAAAQAHIAEAFVLWRRRSDMPWDLVVDPFLVRTYFKSSLPPNPYSPCVRICNIQGQVCVGCGRSMQEIAAWPAMSLPERLSATEILRSKS